MRSILAMAFAVSLVLTTSVMAQNNQPRITGQVVDSSGQAVSDAMVVMVAHGAPTDSHLKSTTDINGKFTLNPEKRGTSVYYSIVAWMRGYGVGHVRNQTSEVYSESGAIPRARDLSITLPRAKPVTFKIVDLEGSPVPNAKVRARAVSNQGSQTNFYAEGRGIEQLGRQTNEDGIVTIDYLPADATGSLIIESKEHGSQMATVSAHQTEDDLVLKLLPTSELKIAFSADSSTNVSRRKVSVNVRLDKQSKTKEGEPTLRITYGTSTLVTNEKGIAQGRVLAGKASIYMASEPGDTSFPDLSKAAAIQLKPGELSEHRFEFKPGIRISGRAVDTEGQPVAGVEIGVLNNTLTTDQDGQYETIASATGQLYSRVVSVPNGYVMPYQSYGRIIENREGKAVLQQPDTIVGLAAKLTGVVVDEKGQPVAGASVNAAWTATDPQGQSFTRRTDATETDSNGRYEFQHVLKDVSILLSAKTNDSASTATTVHTEKGQDVELKVSTHGMLNIVGTVRGSDGSVVKNAEIKVTRAMLVADGNNYGNRPLRLNGQDSFFGNESGAFTTPTKIPRFGQYALKIGAPGYLSKQTKFLKPSESGDLDVGETILPRARTASGTVVDSSGEPVKGASVSAFSSEKVGDHALARKMVSTDAEGNFSIDEIHPQSAMALVQKGRIPTVWIAVASD